MLFELQSLNVEAIADEIDRTAVAVVPNFMSRDAVAAVRAFAHEQVERNGGRYTYLTRERLTETALGDLALDGQFLEFLDALYRRIVGRDPDPQTQVFPALRCLKGTSGEEQSVRFHYDSYALTALISIERPTTGARGDFLYFPNVRKVRRSAVANVLDKVAVQNPLSGRLIASRLFASKVWAPRRLDVVPGNLYIFAGYRTLHGNDRCDPSSLRATALFHYGDPHANSRLVRAIHRRVARRAADSTAPDRVSDR